MFTKGSIKYVRVFFSCVLSLCLIVVSFAGSVGSVDVQGFEQYDSLQDPLQVLFIGSSYFNYNHLPDIFSELCVSADKSVFVDGVIHNGWYLENHVNSPQTQEKIAQRSWDVVVLQGVGTNCAYPDHFTDHPLLPALESLAESIWESNADAKILYAMPWAFEDGMTWYQDWTDDFVRMQDKIFSNTLNVSSEIGCCVAPVGWAWKQVLVDYDFPLHFLHMSDWNHPTMRGSYLMGAVIFSSIFVESCVGLEFFSGLNVSEARYFQQVASDVVLQNLSLWNLFSDEWVYVDDDNVAGPHLGSLEYPFCCISDGLAACEVGGSVFVFEGVYAENLLIEKSVSLVGQDSAEVFVDGGGGSSCVMVNASDVVFSDLSFCNTSWGGLYALYWCDGLVVSNCCFCDVGIGITVGYLWNVSVSDCVFENNSVGVVCVDVCDACFEGNVFYNNMFGLWFSDLVEGSSSVVLGNVFKRNECGLFIAEVPKNVLRILGNDFLESLISHADFFNARCVWKNNFWDDKHSLSPFYVVKGKIGLPWYPRNPLPWFGVDWNPSSEPNCL